MYHPTSRVLAVLELLQSRKRMTGAELAQRLEVNIRTLRRYITTLQDLGIPIIAERGRNGFYELEGGYHLPPMIFTDDEALALELGLIAVTQLGLKEKLHAIESARSKLERVMPDDIQTKATTLSQTIHLELDTFSTQTASNILLTVSNATQNQVRLRFCYRSRENFENERDVDPYGIACLKGLWYVVGWCHLRNAMRSFRLDRILTISMTTTHFIPPQDFDALSYMEQALATLPRQYSFNIFLKTNLRTAQAELSHIFGILQVQDEGVCFRGSVDDIDWFARQLASLSFEFIINSPVNLHSALRKHINQLLGNVNYED